MGMFEEIKGKVGDLVEGHPDKVEELSDQGLDRANDALDGATDGRFSDKIDQGQQVADDRIGQ